MLEPRKSRVVPHAFVFAAVFGFWAAPVPAPAQELNCARAEAPLLDMGRLPQFTEARTHPLTWTIHEPNKPNVSPPLCPGSDLDSLARRIVEQITGVPIRSIPPARTVILGEVHDNPAHHALRAMLIEAVAKHSPERKPALVFEHIRADQKIALDSALAAKGSNGAATTPEALFAALEWDKSGWPEQAMFAPLFATALRHGLPIFAGDPTRDAVRAVARGGLGVLDETEREKLGLGAELAAPLQDALLTELEASHCGMMPKARFTNMAAAQRYRDHYLAAALLAAEQIHGGAILLAGNGHARRDRGVPMAATGVMVLKGVRQGGLSVMLLEVEDGKTDPAAYVPRDPEGRPAVDIIVFTPRTARTDPCIEMRKQFSKPR